MKVRDVLEQFGILDFEIDESDGEIATGVLMFVPTTVLDAGDVYHSAWKIYRGMSPHEVIGAGLALAAEATSVVLPDD